MAENVLAVKNRKEFRKWLERNNNTERECWVALRRGRPADDMHFWYVDAVEEALCFGWIDSTLGSVDGIRMQRFSPRSKNSEWTELNKERARRLERMGLMTDAGRAVLPDMNFKMDVGIEEDIKKAGVWTKFSEFHELYKRIRVGNLLNAKKRSEEEYRKAFDNFVKNTKNGNMYGEWNDYGRLL